MSAGRASRAERVYLQMVADHQTAILNYVYRLVGDRETAEDLTQETYAKAYRALARLDLADASAARRRGWLYRIAHNTATDYLRQGGRFDWLPLSTLRHRSGRDPEAEIAVREPLQEALGSLSDEQRQVLLLFCQAGLSAAEVATVLGITPDAARKRRQRAREAFEVAYRQALGES